MALLDQEKLEAHLQGRLGMLRTLLDQEEHAPTRMRILGAIRGIEKLIPELDQFRVERTPINKISAPTKQLVRSHARGTSWAAALDQTGEKRQRMYRGIYLLLSTLGPLTDHELRDAMDEHNFEHSWSGVSARRVELERAGWVRDTGEKRETQFGKKATVWAAVPEDA